jgi:hypothetical protein
MERERGRKNVMGRPIEEIATRFIGLSVPVSLHEEIRQAAAKERMSATQLYRKIIVEYLDRETKG